MKKPSKVKSLIIITGMSGSGKHTAFKAFEDLGYFCVDNLPIPLIPRLIHMAKASGGEIDKVAITIDIRLGEGVSAFQRLHEDLKKQPLEVTVIFFDASNKVLARRYSETRRLHPLARDTSLLEGLQEERKRVASIRSLADVQVDTTDFSVHDLRNFIYNRFRVPAAEGQLNLSVVSFGFKHGIPYNSDMVFDVRFLPNPHFVEGLRAKTGNDAEVCEYMMQFGETEEIIERIAEMIRYLFPKYLREGKSYLTVSIGCTGGKHRSVMVANAVKERLEGQLQNINLIHRDLHTE